MANLTPDFVHHRRMTTLSQILNGLIAQTVGDSYALMLYLNNAENEQQVISPMFNTVVEDNIVRVDMLKNTIQSIEKPIGNSILKSRSINSSNQG